ncbi:MAG: CYTH domain-containing protein [Clostridia bacterium]|nr:CYTH domain-containing protein [Clostridia bacterium]
MAFIEHELKFLLTEDRFAEVRERAKALFPEASCEVVTQVNHYYDTPDYALHKQGITLRIREKDGRLHGEIKRHNFGKSHDSREEQFEADGLPAKLVVDGVEAASLGTLETVRESLILPTYRLDFDVSTYWGRRDYELEIEFQESALPEVLAIVSRLGLEDAGKMPGKYSRFLAAREFFLKTR